jgi:hypothetical protein
MFNNKINITTAITVFLFVYIKIYAICDNIALLFYKPLKDRAFADPRCVQPTLKKGRGWFFAQHIKTCWLNSFQEKPIIT